MMIGMFLRLKKPIFSGKHNNFFFLRQQMPSAIFIYSPFPFSAYDEKSIPIAKGYDLMSIRL
jgi:hypothetical protein